MGRKFVWEPKHQWGALRAKEVRWAIAEMVDINAEDGIEKPQRVNLKLRLGASYVYEAKFAIYDVKGFDIVLGKRQICHLNQRCQIDDRSNHMWIADNSWEEREDGREHYVPGRHPLDVDKEIVEQANFMGIHIILKAELKNVSTCLLKQSFLINLHHRGDGDTLPTDKPLGESHDLLTEFQGLFGEPTKANSTKERQGDSRLWPTRMTIYHSAHHRAFLHMKKNTFRGR